MTTNTEIIENVCRMRAAVGQPEGMRNGEEDMWTGESIIVIIVIIII
jgi:hypothetical protein